MELSLRQSYQQDSTLAPRTHATVELQGSEFGPCSAVPIYERLSHRPFTVPVPSSESRVVTSSSHYGFNDLKWYP